MCEKTFDVMLPKVFRMFLIMEQDIPLNPVSVGALGADAVMLESDDVENLIQESWLGSNNTSITLQELGRVKMVHHCHLLNPTSFKII
jgi:hypothetical protein